jgi:predicted dehydrogenase
VAPQKLRVGLVGYGYWGPNLARNFTASPHTQVVRVADRDARRREAVTALYPWVATSAEADDLFADPQVDAVAIVTPLATHVPLARAALQAGKHVLVEKPLARTRAECEELARLAEAQRRVLMVDHTFVYTGAVRKIRELVDSGYLGRVLYFDSVRINLGLFQPDSNVLWDLAPHDLSILDHVLGKQPRWVSALGAKHYGQVENLAYMTVGFDDDLLAHFHCNWVSPVKVRRIQIAGTQRMLVYDDTEPSEKIRIYDAGVSVSQTELDHAGKSELLVQYRTGDVLAPKLDGTEALRRVVDEFARACRESSPALTDVKAGTRVVALLEAAEKSLAQHGARVEVQS